MVVDIKKYYGLNSSTPTPAPVLVFSAGPYANAGADASTDTGSHADPDTSDNAGNYCYGQGGATPI